jgi:hypothetical protein
MANDDLDRVTLEEARASLEDPVKGSLRILKALGKYRDIYRSQLENGELRLEVSNELEQVAAEEALADYSRQALEDGEKIPRITIVKPKIFEWK